ncbi:Uu.00g002570.m01.CDS01 [Anthostomella pinea]|uniref:Uu.00g002570.m01.CDS01 n=1 Tax=Anthostomella pinea TaxID=933095 RepID=A0AAI8VK75_9PEZI|nr:Uu.00g002570.m01.CDS01 [Anthostomella pinea]
MAGTRFARLLPFSAATTPLQATTYLLGISLFSISFLVFLNSAVSFVITDLLDIKRGVGDIVGTLGFVDELVALVACPLWGLLSDRLGVRWVAVIGYAVIGVSLFGFVQARNVYPALVLARMCFAVGATAAATMVTAVLPVLTDDGDVGEVAGREEDEEGRLDVEDAENGDADGSDDEDEDGGRKRQNPRYSVAMSLESDVTITPERFLSDSQLRRGSSVSHDGASYYDYSDSGHGGRGKKPSALAGYVGLFTGCGALVALVLFLPLPAQFSKKEGVTPAQAITESFYVVGAVALCVAVFVFFGLRGLRGEEGKGWRMLLGLRKKGAHNSSSTPVDPPTSHDAAYVGTSTSTSSPSTSNSPNGDNGTVPASRKPTTTSHNDSTTPLPYRHLLLTSLRLGATDPHIALGYLGGFVARASTVAISLFIPLYINAYYISNGFCTGSPHDPSPELKKECRAAYVLASILSGVAQLCALLCAPAFGYVAARRWRGINVGVGVAALLGVVGYVVFPRLRSPEFRDVDGRGGDAVVFLVVAMLGVSQIGAIVCSLGSLGRGVLGVAADDVPVFAPGGDGAGGADRRGDADNDEGERAALLENGHGHGRRAAVVSRVHLKGSIAGVYSWCGGAAILLLTKLGGYLFDVTSRGAPFYMMAVFNGILLVASLGMDLGSGYRDRRRRRDRGGV